VLLGEILHPRVIQTTLDAQDKFEAIDELVGLLVSSGDLSESLREPVSEVIVAREVSMSTGMESGVALPHGSTNRIHRVIGALGLAPSGIPFDSLDGQPARLIVLLVLPRYEFHVHVRTLAGVSHLLNDERFRGALMRAETPDDIMNAIRGEERSSIFDRYRWRLRRGD